MQLISLQWTRALLLQKNTFVATAKNKALCLILNLMKQWEGHDEEEGAKEQVEKPLLVFPCHHFSNLDIFTSTNSSFWYFPVIQRLLKSNFILTYQARQARQAYHQSLRRHPCVIIKQS